MRLWFSLLVRKGHQPRQPVRRGIQHPNFTELVIYNSASFLSVLLRRFGRALPPRRAWTQISRFRDGVIIAYFDAVVNQPVVYFRFFRSYGVRNSESAIGRATSPTVVTMGAKGF